MEKTMKKKNISKKIKKVLENLQLITDNFRVFVEEVIGLNNAQFHKELDDTLSMELNRKLCIALPRGFGKSTHLSVAYPLWEIAKNHNLRILLVSGTAEVSRNFMSEIVNNIERNKKYQLWAKAICHKGKGVRPRLRSRQKREEHWSMNSITIDRDDLNLKDPTINAVGLFGSILSKRADIIVVDDVVDQENSNTEEQRQKIKDWIYTTLMPVLVPGGRFIYLGNTWHMDDLVSNLLKDPQFDIRKRIPAILHEATKQNLWEEWSNIQTDESLYTEDRRMKAKEFYKSHKEEMNEGVEVLWPERFPYADLYMQRISNPFSFARMYQCDPSIRPNQEFSEKDIEKALQKGIDMILQDESRTEINVDITTSGLDLAISENSRGDDTALLSIDRVGMDCGEIKKGDFVIRNIERGKFQPKETLRKVSNHYNIARPIAIRVENNGFQTMMVGDLGDLGIPITSYHTGGEKNDSDIGVHSLATLLSQGKLVLPYSNKDGRTRKLITQLVNEMRAYPDGHTGDSLMALWFAYSEARDRFSNRMVIPSNTPSPTESLSLDEEAEMLDKVMSYYLRQGWRMTLDQARAWVPKYKAEMEWGERSKQNAKDLLDRAEEALKRAHQDLQNEEPNTFDALMRRRRLGY
jgi:hypothetical protein